MIATAQYKELNRQLHETTPEYGVTGHRYADIVRELMQAVGMRDILDYGCGKRTLEMALGFPITNYDPCIPGLDEPPRPHAIVACTDVLEHVEPECLDATLADLRRVTRQICFVTIDQQRAQKTLADGRNAHLIIEGAQWWLPRLWAAGFKIRGMTDSGRRIKATLA
jgi:hypothetical protein